MVNQLNLRRLASLLGFRSRADRDPGAIDWLRVAPFVAMHLGCLAVFWVGWSPLALAVAIVLYVVRVFALTGFYHRYFSHRAFKTGRVVQFLFAVLGASAGQRGPLWWAAHHRHHHATADTPGDPHSPRHRGFWHSHMAWFLTNRHFATRADRVRDWMKFPELRFLDSHDGLVPLALGVSLFALGEGVARAYPHSGVSGAQLLVWGLISTVAVYHVTFTVNSLAHRWGSRRYATRDDSRNNPLIALMTFGEGWHNNHHHYPASARQGFYWWEVDVTWYGLLLMERLGLIRDLKRVPPKKRDAWKSALEESPLHGGARRVAS
jgi:stearoyl-CoA desaturase (delta-9 desaturase)